jgi:MFS family permease
MRTGDENDKAPEPNRSGADGAETDDPRAAEDEPALSHGTDPPTSNDRPDPDEFDGDRPGAAMPAGRAVAFATTVTVMTALPMFLVGALSVPLRSDLAFGPAALGGAIGVFRASGALAAAPFGRLADRIGAARAMRAAVLMAAIGTAGIGLFARSWGALALGLALCGVSSSFGQTAANRYLIRVVKQRRQGLAFGIKQSAMPTGSMLAGLMVPAIGLTLGWRATFLLIAGLGFAVVFLLPKPRVARGSVPASTATAATHDRLPLLVLTVALMCGMAAASTLAAFTVESGVASGLDVSTAALLLTAGSIAAIIFRVIIGFIADRMFGGHLKLVSAMLAFGAVGYVLLGLGRPGTLVIGTVIAFGLGWGFNGLFWFAVIRLHREAPAATTGMIMPGGMLGGVIGPMTFGAIVERASFASAWFTVAASAALGAVLMQVGLRMLSRREG